MKLDHISHSQLDLYNRCPRAWKYRYIDKISTPSSSALALGDCYHRTLEYNFKYKMGKGEDIDLDIIPDIFKKHWHDILHNSEIDWGDDNQARIFDIGVTLVSKYIEDIAPLIQPLAVEKWIETSVAGTKFVLRLDLIDQHNAVIDHKTSGKRYSQKDTDNDMQASAVAFALGKPIIFYNHVAVKTKNLGIQIIKSYRTQEDIDWWYDMAECTVNLMLSGYYPPRTDSWLCSSQYCGFYGICKGHLDKIYIG